MSEANKTQVGGDHYKTGIQHWDYVVANDMPYLEAQVVKYVTRHKKKNGMQDLQKARHFLDKLIEVEELRRAGKVLVTATAPDPAVVAKLADPEHQSV